jgi:predicted Zn-dependent protease
LLINDLRLNYLPARQFHWHNSLIILIMKTIKNLMIIACFGAMSAIPTGCSTNAATGRSQLNLVSSQDMLAASKQQYAEFLSKNKVVNNTAEATMVKQIGSRIASAITRYYAQQGQQDLLAGYEWEYNLVDSKEVNAWCMPGGKIVVYTGILPVSKNTNALAVVMGHEIAHAVAEHGRERVSEQMAAQAGGLLFSSLISSNPQQAENIFMVANGVTTYGLILPHSRKQELEADKLGLMYCAMAGYDPREAVPLWERMAALSNGQAPPEFASTHPATSTRINKIKDLLPEAMKYYNASKSGK